MGSVTAGLLRLSCSHAAIALPHLNRLSSSRLSPPVQRGEREGVGGTGGGGGGGDREKGVGGGVGGSKEDFCTRTENGERIKKTKEEKKKEEKPRL